MSLKQKAVKGVVWSALESWGGQAISLVVFFLLARILGPKAFGLVALASIFISFVGMFLDQGFSTAIIQRHELEAGHLDTAFWVNLGISLLLTIFGIFAAGLIANLFDEQQLIPIIRWLSLSFLINGFGSVQNAIFQRNLVFKTLAVRSLVATTLGGVVGVVMAFSDLGVWSLVGKQLVDQLVRVLVLWLASDWRPGFNASAKQFRELFSFGVNMVGIKIINFLNMRADDLLIGYFLGSVELGYYSVAYRLLLVMIQLLTGIVTKVAMPTFSKLQEEPEKLRGAFYTVTQLTSLISFPIFLGMAALAPELISLVFGEKWLPSIRVMQILAFNGIYSSVISFSGIIITAIGKPSLNLKVGAIHSVANVIGFAIAVHWGIIAVASTFVIRGYLLAPIRLFLLKKLVGIELIAYFRQYTAPLAAAVAMLFVILGIKYFLNSLISPYILLAICILTGFFIYTLTVRFIAPKLFQKVLDLVKLVMPLKAVNH